MSTTRSRGSRSALWSLLALALLLSVASAACYNNNSGDAQLFGGLVKFKLPAFPDSGAHAVVIFSEMHYQPIYRAQEGPRLLPPPDSVPVTGPVVVDYAPEEYRDLQAPASVRQAYDPARGAELYRVNCQVCHGVGLEGDGPLAQFINKTDATGKRINQGPLPANLKAGPTARATDGEIFAFISKGGRLGFGAYSTGTASRSPMPAFDRLLTEEERWTLVLFLRGQIGQR